MENVFDQAKRRLDAIEEARDSYEKEIGQKCDWSNPEDVAEYRRWKNKKVREQRVPQDRICPKCKQRILDLSRWVVKTDVVCCRSCYQMMISVKTPKGPMEVVPAIFGEDIQIRVPINYEAIVEARSVSGVSRRKFAGKVGWSYERQRDLEYGKIKTIDLDTAHSILCVLAELGVITEDDLPGGI